MVKKQKKITEFPRRRNRQSTEDRLLKNLKQVDKGYKNREWYRHLQRGNPDWMLEWDPFTEDGGVMEEFEELMRQVHGSSSRPGVIDLSREDDPPEDIEFTVEEPPIEMIDEENKTPELLSNNTMNELAIVRVKRPRKKYARLSAEQHAAR